MIVTLSNCIIKSVSKNVDIDPEYYDYYKYGIEITISSIFCINPFFRIYYWEFFIRSLLLIVCYPVKAILWWVSCFNIFSM